MDSAKGMVNNTVSYTHLNGKPAVEAAGKQNGDQFLDFAVAARQGGGLAGAVK